MATTLIQSEPRVEREAEELREELGRLQLAGLVARGEARIIAEGASGPAGRLEGTAAW